MKPWGPDLNAPGVTLLWLQTGLEDLSELLVRLAAMAKELGVPVQALRADRVLSETHLVMAAEHARRTRAAGRHRADDPAVELLLFAAGDRQIHRAVTALGLERGDIGPLVLVALAPVPPADLEAAAKRHLLARLDANEPHGAACRWWAERLGLSPDAARTAVESALLAEMALLALDKP